MSQKQYFTLAYSPNVQYTKSIKKFSEKKKINLLDSESIVFKYKQEHVNKGGALQLPV